jgi:WD40 repeat protein
MQFRTLAVTLLVIALSVVESSAQTLRARLVHTFRGHTGESQELAFSPDSRMLATGSVDGKILIWRLADRKLARQIMQPGGMTSLDFSPDGQLLVAGGYDQVVRIWRVADGVLVRSLTGHGATIWATRFSPDGTMIASGGEDKTIRVWRVSDGKQLLAMPGHALNIWRIAFSPDSRLVLSASFDRTVRVWSIASGKTVRTLTGHGQAVVGLSVKRDLIATGSDDSSIKLWRLSDGKLLHTLTGGSNHVYATAISTDGQWVVSGGRERGAIGTMWKQMTGTSEEAEHDPTARLWRARDGALIQTFADHADDVRSVAISNDTRWMATGSADKTMKLYELVRP